ncbi:MAG TPA: ScbR family autoregulator-binding transcription factor [Streptomyces sp.]
MTQQDRAVRTHQELIRSAAEAFDRYGFASASLTGISTGAGVSSGALHFHFSSKRALGEAVESAAAQALMAILTVRPPGNPTPLQLLVHVSQLLGTRLTEDAVLRAGFALAADATWQGTGALWPQWCTWVRSVLELAGSEGDLAADVVLDDAVAAVTTVVVGSQVLGRADSAWCPRLAVTRFWNLLLPRISA